jgi:GNAT superfamily N-acetyltransferase
MKQQLRFSPVSETDFPEIALLQPEYWADIMPTIRWYKTLDFCYLVKATLKDEVVGCGAALVHEDCVWLANIIVAKEFRNKGIGTVITEHLITYAQQHRSNVLLIATRLGKPVYETFGFKEDSGYTFFKAHKIVLPVSEYIIPYEPQYKNAILKLDHEVIGEHRLNLLHSRLKESFVFVKDGVFEGFCIPNLGEGLTIANTPEAGLALLAWRLREEKRACLPTANTVAIEFLLSQGYKIDENLWAVKMYLNKKTNWDPTRQYGRVGGNMG